MQDPRDLSDKELVDLFAVKAGAIAMEEDYFQNDSSERSLLQRLREELLRRLEP